MTEDAPQRPGEQRRRLEAYLALLDSDSVADLLPKARLDVLSFAATGASMARRVLAIEEASRLLLEPSPPSDPIALEDAHTVRTSSLKAMDQLCQALGLISAWVMGAPSDAHQTARMIRTLLHSLNNTLVGINCYAELLASDSQHSDVCHAALAIICREGSAISRLVRERAALQRQLGELSDAETDNVRALEQEILTHLLQSLALEPHAGSSRQTAADSDEISQRLAALPLAEKQVGLEALRRIRNSQF